MTKMQDHIRNHMIQVKDDEWGLDRDPSKKLERTLAVDPDKLSRYQQGVNSLNEGLDPESLPDFKWIHKNFHVVHEIHEAQARYRSLQAEHAAEAVQAPAQAQAPASEAVQTQAPASNKTVVKESLKTLLEEEAPTKRAPKPDTQKARKIEIGAHRGGPHK